LFALRAFFYSHRPLWALIISGVFDRFPKLRLVLAEAGSSWIANTLEATDNIQAKQEEGTFPNPAESLSHTFAGIDPDEVVRMVSLNAAEM
jgi:predicted TIM-barrel fold metal-dependent hydrolase